MTDHTNVGPGSNDPGPFRSPEMLLRVLADIRDRGGIGTTDLDAAIRHAERFVAALPAVVDGLADLGSGGGLPGLVIAVRRPDVRVVLVERRTARADLLRRAVAALGLGDRVAVHGEDVRTLAAARPASFDVVTARSFGAPRVTARWAAVLLRPGGVLLVSEPPMDDPARWPAHLLRTLGLADDGVTDGIRRLRRFT